MNTILKYITHGIIGCFINYAAFVEKIFLFQIISWVILAMAFLGLCVKDTIKQFAKEVNFFTYLFSFPFIIFALWILFYHNAKEFGYFYLLFLIVSQSLLIAEKLKTKL